MLTNDIAPTIFIAFKTTLITASGRVRGLGNVVRDGAGLWGTTDSYDPWVLAPGRDGMLCHSIMRCQIQNVQCEDRVQGCVSRVVCLQIGGYAGEWELATRP